MTVGILEWLGQLFASLIPPWVLVPKTHTAVRQRNLPLPVGFKLWADKKRRDGKRFLWLVHYAPEGGVYVRECGSGFVLKIPFIDEVWELPTTLESEDLSDLEAETRDGEKYQLSPVLTWKVANPIKACFAVQNYADSLHNEVRATVVRWINGTDSPLQVERMERECSEQVRRIGADWGCFAKALSFNSCSRPWQKYELVHSAGVRANNGHDCAHNEHAGEVDG